MHLTTPTGWPPTFVLACLVGVISGCAPAEDAVRLFADLEHPDFEARQDAAERLDKIIIEGDHDVFLRGIESPTDSVRIQSIIYLARMPQPEARAAFRDLLRSDRRMMLPYNPIRMKPSTVKTDSRILVAHLIRTIGGDPEAIDVLIEGQDLDRPAEELTGTCLAIGALGDPRGIPTLKEASRHREIAVVRAAAQALGQFDQPEVMPALKVLSTHPVYEVRTELISMLGGRKTSEALDLVKTMGANDPSADIRAAAIQMLVPHRDRSFVPYLTERLSDSDPVVRSAASRVLATLTGQAPSERAEDWRRWWAEHGDDAPASR